MEPSTHEFAELVTEHQQRMYRYVVSLLGNADAAWDVLQETNRVLLEKRDEFAIGTNFANWALTVARFQTMAWLRNQKRDRLVATPEIVEILAEDAQILSTRDEARVEALEQCLKGLSQEHRRLLCFRYARSESLSKLSERTGKKVNALKQLFFRLRGTLMECIELRLRAG